MALGGLLLSGGSARRLGGQDKAALMIGRQTLLARASAALAAVTDPVVVVGAEMANEGPLAAVSAGWARAKAGASPRPLDGAIVLAVDMPFVTVELLRWLADRGGTTVPVAGGRDQPLCARYTATLLDRAAAVLAAGDRSMMALLALDAVHRADEDEWRSVAAGDAFADIDTPADLDAARRRLGL